MERPKLEDFNRYVTPHAKILAYSIAQDNYINALVKELIVTDDLLKEQHRVIDEIPECKVNGDRCIPSAIDWIKEQKQKL